MKKVLILFLTFAAINVFFYKFGRCVSSALENNNSHKQSQEQKNAAIADYKAYKGSLYPQLTLSGSYGLTKTDPPEILDGGIPEEEMNLNTQLELSQILFSAGVFNGLKAARIYNEIQSESVDLSERNIIFETHAKFYDAILMKEVLAINNEALEIAEKHYLQIKDLYEQGFTSEYDMLRAELEYENLKPEVQTAENNYSMSLKSLGTLIGIDQMDKVDGDFILPEIMEMELSDLKNEAMKNRMELKLTQLNEDIRKVNYRNEKMSYLPSLFLKANLRSYTYSDITTDSYSVGSENFGTQASANIVFSMPLFTGLTNQNKIKKAKAEHKLAVLENNILKDNIQLEVENNYLELQKNLTSLKNTEKSLELADKSLKIAQTRYGNKFGTILEIMDAQLAYKQSKLNHQMALYNIIKTYEKLITSLGRSL